MKKMIEVQHEGIEGTATVPETALPRMRSRGWYPVGEQPPATTETESGDTVVIPEDIAALTGADLKTALEAAELPTSGKAAEKRARLAEHRLATTTSDDPADPGDDDGAGDSGD